MTHPHPNPHPHHSPLTTTLLTHSLPANPIWLSHFLSSSTTTTTSIPDLTTTAKHQILTSDIRNTLSTAAACILPKDINSPTGMAERRLVREVVVQILDLMDVGTSLGAQVEGLEMLGRGEARGKGQGRGVVVRVVNDPDDGDGDGGEDGGGGGNGKAGAWKILMQDAAGNLVWGFDCEGCLDVDVDGLQRQKNVVRVGSKVLLRKGCLFARGVAMIERQSVSVLGGSMEGLEKAWREGRLARLKALMPGSERGREER